MLHQFCLTQDSHPGGMSLCGSALETHSTCTHRQHEQTALLRVFKLIALRR